MLELDALREAFPEVGAFRTALVAGLADAGYAPNEYGLNDVLLHIAIALDRVAANHPLDDADADAATARRTPAAGCTAATGRRPRARSPTWSTRLVDRALRHDDRRPPTSRTSRGCSRRGRRRAPPRRRTRMPRARRISPRVPLVRRIVGERVSRVPHRPRRRRLHRPARTARRQPGRPRERRRASRATR